MNFVAGGKVEIGTTFKEEQDTMDDADARPGLGARTEDEEAEEEGEEEAEDEFANVRLPMSFGGKRRGGSVISDDEDNQQAEAPQTTSWGSSYGARLLAKFGWTGGGIKTSTGEGIDRPIEVKLRGKQEGLGFRGSEKTQQQIEMEMKQAGLRPAEPEKKKKKSTKKKKEPAWKKKLTEGEAKVHIKDEDEMDVEDQKKRRKGKKTYKTAEEVLASRKPEKQLILDMTQAQPRVLTDIKEATKGAIDKRTKDNLPGIPAPELRHNIKFYVDTKEMELHNIDRRIRQEEATAEKLKKQEERLQKSIASRAEQMKRIKTIMEIVDKCNDRIKSNDMPLETLEKVFDMFRNKYAAEYEAYNLSSLAYALVGPLVKGKMIDWKPLQDPGLLVELVTTWRKILRQEPDVDKEPADKDDISERILRRKGPNTTDTYNRMIVDIVLPVIRRVIINEWNPRDFESGIRLVRLWAPPVLTKEAYENLMVHFIYPKIAREVENWNPRQDRMPIHSWLHPWRPFLGKQMEALYPTIRQKLTAALTEWHPSDPSAHAILLPWQGVFDKASMETLLGRSILPKLILSLRGTYSCPRMEDSKRRTNKRARHATELVINPLQQVLDPFNWAMSWVDMISADNFIPLLEMEFFPKWFAVLNSWLSSSAPNFEEVSRWYTGWKQLFPATLQAHPRMQTLFNHALEIMNYHVQRIMAGGTINIAAPSLQPPTATVTAARPATAQAPQQPTTAPTAGGKEPTMKEVVARWAEDNDLLFIPQARMHEGKQVYSFGKLAIYVDKDLVYAPPPAGAPADQWQPISFDELVARGR